MTTDYTQIDLRDFLHSLDNSKISITDWEAEFLDSMFGWDRDFSPKQCMAIERMIEKYAEQINW